MLKTENTVKEIYFDYTVEGFNGAKDYLISEFGCSEDVINRMDSYEVVTKANSKKRNEILSPEWKWIKPFFDEAELLDDVSHSKQYIPSYHDYLSSPIFDNSHKPYTYDIVKRNDDGSLTIKIIKDDSEVNDELVKRFQTYMLDEFDLEFTIYDANRVVEFFKKIDK